VTSLALSAKGDVLISGSSDNAVRVWNLKTRQLLKECPSMHDGGQQVVSCVAIAPEGDRFVSAGATDPRMELRNADGSRALVVAGHENRLRDFVVDVARRRLLTVGDGRILEWDWGGELGRFRYKVDGVRAITLSPSGGTLFTVDAEGHVLAWDVRTAKKRRVTTLEGAFVSTAQVSANGAILTVADRGVVHVFKLEKSGAVVPQAVASGPPAAPFLCVRTDPKGRRVLASQGKRLFVFNASTGATESTWDLSHDITFELSPDGSTAFVCHGDELSAMAVPKGDVLWTQRNVSYIGEAACSPDGKYLATAEADRLVIRDVQTGARVDEIAIGSDALRRVRWADETLWGGLSNTTIRRYAFDPRGAER
jgi:WD40 repeat protein